MAGEQNYMSAMDRLLAEVRTQGQPPAPKPTSVATRQPSGGQTARPETQAELQRLDQAISQLEQEARTNNFGAKPRLGVSGSAQYQLNALRAKRNGLAQQVSEGPSTGFLGDAGQTLDSAMGRWDQALGYVTGQKDVEERGRTRQRIAEEGMSQRGREVSQKGVLGDDMSLGDRAYAAGLAVTGSVPDLVGGAVAAGAIGALAPEAAALAVGTRVLQIAAKSPRIASLLGISAGTGGREAAIQAGRMLITSAAGSGVEGVQSGVYAGSDNKQAALEQIESNPDAFRTSKLGQKLLRETNGDFEAAKQMAAEQIGTSAALSTGIATSILSIPGSVFEARLLRGAQTGNIAKELGIGAGAEALQEAPQSGAERLISNVGMQRVGSDVGTFEGVGKAAGEGAIVGGLMGGGLGGVGGVAGRLTGNTEQEPPQEDEELAAALAAREQVAPVLPQETAQLTDQTRMGTMGDVRVAGMTYSPQQLLEIAANNEANPRIGNILAQPVDDGTKVQQVARILNEEEATRVEPEAVRRISSLVGGTIPVSQSRQFITDELTKIGDEVVEASATLRAIRDTVNSKAGGKQFVGTLRGIVQNYSPPAPNQTFFARPERGGDGSVIMTNDQVAEEAQREREAQQAFRMAERRQQRFDQATGQGTQREDIRPGAPEPEQQFFLNPSVYGEELGGTVATIVGAEGGKVRIQYESSTEMDANGAPVTISEDVDPTALFDRVVRGTPRMSQELAGDLRKPRTGTGTNMNPRQSVDRTSTRAVTTTPEPGTLETIPNFTMTGRQEQPFVYEAQPSLNAQDTPAPQGTPQVEGTVQSAAQTSGAPGAAGLPAPAKQLPAPAAKRRMPPSVPEREENTPEQGGEDQNVPEREDIAEEDMLDVEEHPRMVEHNERYDEAVERVQEAENATEVRKLAKRMIKEGLLDEDAYTDIDERMKDVPNAERYDEGMAALEDAIEEVRDNVGSDIADEIRSEDPRYYSGRVERAGPKKVKASDVVARTTREADTAKAEEPKAEAEPDIDYDAVINDRLEKIAGRGRQGTVVAKRLRSLLKQNSYDARQLYYAFQMGEVFSRVLPKNAKVDILFVPSMKAESAGAAAASGISLGEEVAGEYKAYSISQNGFRGLITMSLSDGMLGVARENAAHEAFHVIQDMLREYDPQAFETLNQSFRNGMTIDDLDASILRKLKTITTDGDMSVYDSLIDSFGTAPLSKYEAQAVAFGALLDAKDRGVDIKGLKASFIRVVDFLSDLFREFGNLLRKGGIQSVADVFEGYRLGRAQENLTEEAPLTDGEGDVQYSGRVPKTPLVASSLEHNFGVLQNKTFRKGRDLKEFIQARVKSALENSGIDAMDYESDATLQHLVKVAIKDANYALQENANAIGWYDEKVTKALRVLSLVHPEIATDPKAKFAFVWALAVTSNGLKVNPNFELAEKAYAEYKKTGAMPTKIGIGTASDAIDGHMKLFNALMNRLGFEELERLMTTKATVKQIESETGISISGEGKAEMVFGAAILGPKIGNGFFANLYGHFDQLTMDRWLMRSWGRWTGSLIEINQKNVEKTRATLTRLIEALSDSEVEQVRDIIGVDPRGDVDTVARAIEKASIKPVNRSKLNEIAVRLDGLEDIVGKGTAKSPLYSFGDQVRKKGNGLAKYLDGQKEAPAGAGERQFIRKVFGKALKKLQRQYPKLTMADLQALLWYPEKRLYEAAKTDDVSEGYEDDEAPDYANAAVLVARNAGVSDEQIQAEIRAVDAGRRADVGAAGAGRGGAGRTEVVRFSGRTGKAKLAAELRERFTGTPRVEEGLAGKGNVGRRSGGVLASTVTGRVPVAATYSHSEEAKSVFSENGIDAPDFHELTGGKASARLYSRLINDSKRDNPFGASVYVYPQEDYEGMRLFVTKDGLAGFALKGDDIVSAFKSPASTDRGVALSMVRMAVALGGRRLDAFDTVLPEMYSVNGFRAVARMAWNDEYAPDDWSKDTFKAFNNGEPDVVFMAYDPSRDGIYAPDEGEYTDDYDAAVAAQTGAVRYSGRRGRALGPQALRAAPSFKTDNLNFGGEEPGRWDEIVYNLQDKLVDLKRVQKNITDAGGQIGADADVYRAEELYHGRAAKRAKDFIQRELNPLLEDMKAKGISLKQIDEFLHARHAKERNAQIRKINPDMQDGGSGMTDAEADSYINNLPNARRQQLERLAGRVDAIVKNTQQMMVEYGLETQDTIDTWSRTYKSYVPLQREGFEDDGTVSAGQGMSVRGSSSRRALGSDMQVVDILANVAMQRERIISRGERNRVGNALAVLALQNPNDSFWYVIDPKGKDGDKARQKLVAFGMDPDDASNVMGAPVTRRVNPNTGLVEYRQNNLFMNTPFVMATRINGEDKYIAFSTRNPRAQRMVTALKNLDATQMGSLASIGARITRYFSAINTQYNPAFGIYNMMRDLQGAALNLSTTKLAGKQKQVIANALPATIGMYRDLRAERSGGQGATNWAALAEEFELEGGKTGYRDMFATSKDRADAIETELTGGSKLRQAAMKTGGPVFNWLSDFNEAIENGVRLSAYKAAKDMGLSKSEAASIAKNLTVNFNRKGAKGVQAGALYAFFNASVQGTARLAETLTGPAGKKIVAGGLLLGVAQAVALAASGLDDELPEWLKDKNFVIPTGDGKYLAIPMPLGFHAVLAVPRRAVEFFMSGGDKAPQQVVGMIGMLADAFNPIGNAGLSLQTIAPTILDPLAALSENQDFAGRPIYQEDFNSLDPTPGPERNRQGVSAIGDFISRAIDTMTGGDGYVPGAFSPTGDQVDYLLGQITGGAGRFVLNTVSAAESLKTGEDLPNYKIPVVGRMIGDANEAMAVSNRFYEGVKEMNGHKRSVEGMEEKGEDTTAYFERNPEAEFYEAAQDYENDVKKLRKERKQLIEEGAPKEEIDYVTEEMQMLMVEFNQQLADYKRQ